MTQAEDTAVALLRETAVRAWFRRPGDMVSDEERAEALRALEPWLRGAEEMAKEAVRQGELRGEQAVYRALHGAPGVDHEMLDEAADYVRREGEP